ncbi:enoyl-CoA hydratase [Biformimicrobium ophioploci]|uniref:Enoyl-CoA hydratase n=1 Tax=Biformimicrobium ophioploci TaxID=3036711 RepID=A0ABQ6M239_9GAMM|nr:enoyl-CoA hydratase [Microbulbifer sp. NKW57]GMG88397.1 enoyl-CoA hydratase [Microbulbifer sp. NKW57]
MDQLIEVEIDRYVAIVTLNRPEVMNALNAQMRTRLAEVLLELNLNVRVSAVVLTGNGRAFCAGLDLVELRESAEDLAREGVIGANLLKALDDMRCPVIAAVNGYAITGGLELALRCDVIVASSDAVFADTHARVGILPAWGVSQILPRVIGPFRAKELSLSGSKIDAQLAYEWGLVNRIFEPDRLLAAAIGIASDMATCNRKAQHAIKGLIDTGLRLPLEEGLSLEQEASVNAYRVASSQVNSD